MVKNGTVAPAHFAFSCQDGRRLLSENTIYHLVILDLRLPESTGRPASSTRELDARVRAGLAYGRVLAKGDNKDDILAAIQEVQRYCDIGIHIRDGGEA